jgi:hypothetical protein
MGMSTTEKFGKLARAIRRYRGSYRTHAKKWATAPDKAASADVVAWLDKLGISRDSMGKIDGFKSHSEFDAWLKKLQEKPLPIG